MMHTVMWIIRTKSENNGLGQDRTANHFVASEICYHYTTSRITHHNASFGNIKNVDQGGIEPPFFNVASMMSYHSTFGPHIT